jgi:uncharacterized membrane protein YgcG
MDAILPRDTQPPTLHRTYNHHHPSGYIIDRFGFIYDKRRQTGQNKGGGAEGPRKEQAPKSEMLNLDGLALASGASGGGGAACDVEPSKRSTDPPSSPPHSRPSSSSSHQELGEPQTTPKRWQDYLKAATFPTELLSDTPAGGRMPSTVSTATTTTTESSASARAQLTVAERGPLLPASVNPQTSASAVVAENATFTKPTSSDAASPAPNSSRAGGAASGAQEPVRMLLEQLTELHDVLQRERTVKWNEFLRKVRAERRREGEAALASASAAASAAAAAAGGRPDARLMPEAALADGEVIGVAGLGNKGKIGRAKWKEFRQLVLNGIPVAYRAKIWAECSGASAMRTPGLYDELVRGQHDQQQQPQQRYDGGDDSGGGGSSSSGGGGGDGSDSRGDGEGSGSGSGSGDDPAVVAQIAMDVHRTLTDNVFFRDGPGVAKLQEVLLAYARRNPEVGYCQGMNLIAASLLLIVPTSEDAFWLLASMVEHILPAHYYDRSLLASRADQRVLRQYVAQLLPRLSAHLDALGVELEALTFQWFLSVFTGCLSAEALFRVWDVVLCTPAEEPGDSPAGGSGGGAGSGSSAAAGGSGGGGASSSGGVSLSGVGLGGGSGPGGSSGSGSSGSGSSNNNNTAAGAGGGMSVGVGVGSGGISGVGGGSGSGSGGATFLFQVALALLSLNEKALLGCSTPAGVYSYINHHMTNHAISIDGLIRASDALKKVVTRADVEERRARVIAQELGGGGDGGAGSGGGASASATTAATAKATAKTPKSGQK